MFYRHPSADMLLTPDEVDGAALRAAQGAALRLDQPDRRAVAQRHPARDRVARERRLPDLLRPQSAPRAVAGPRPPPARACCSAIAQAQIVKISDEELRFLTGSDDPAAARQQLWHDRLELMVVTLGSAGCVYFTRGYRGRGRRLQRRGGRCHRRGRRLRGRTFARPDRGSRRRRRRGAAARALPLRQRGRRDHHDRARRDPRPADPRARAALLAGSPSAEPAAAAGRSVLETDR